MGLLVLASQPSISLFLSYDRDTEGFPGSFLLISQPREIKDRRLRILNRQDKYQTIESNRLAITLQYQPIS